MRRTHYSASECQSAKRSVECPTCAAKVGEPCVTVRRFPPASRAYQTVSHKRRVDKWYTDYFAAEVRKQEAAAQHGDTK